MTEKRKGEKMDECSQFKCPLDPTGEKAIADAEAFAEAFAELEEATERDRRQVEELRLSLYKAFREVQRKSLEGRVRLSVENKRRVRDVTFH